MITLTLPRLGTLTLPLTAGHAWWLVFGLALVLRIVHLNTPGLWYDESGSTWMASLPLPQLLAATAADVHPPLSMLLLAPLVRVFGPAPWAMRLPSVILSLITLALIRHTGHRLRFPPAATLIAGILFAFLPYQLYYAQEARMYALVQCCIVGATLAALNRRWLWFITLSTLALYSHNYALFYIAALALAAFARELVAPIGKSQLDMILPVALTPFLLFAPWGVVIVFGQMTLYAADWIPPVTATTFIQPVIEFIWPSFNIDLGGWLAGTLLGALFVWVVAAHVWRTPTRTTLFAAYLVAAPMLMALLVSLLWRPMYLFRGFIPSAPFFYLLIGAALVNIRRPLWVVLGLAPILIAGAATYYPNVIRAKETEISPREITTIIVEQWRPGDVIYHGNVGSLLPMWQHTPRELPVYLMPVQGTSLGMLRPGTRAAMGMAEVWIEEIEWQRAWLVWTAGPTIHPLEDKAVWGMLDRYPHQTIQTFQDDFSTFGLWLLYNPAYSVGMK